jgi:LacI family transcriptional regulator
MREVLGDHGLALPEDHVLLGPWSQRWGYEATCRLLDADPRIDGLFCGNDQLAVGAIDALRERGRRVPDDVAVVGFDNWIEFAEETRPPLTTVDMQIYELGRRAGLRMLGMMKGERESGIVRLPCRLVVRESSVPLAPGEPPEARDVTPAAAGAVEGTADQTVLARARRSS